MKAHTKTAVKAYLFGFGLSIGLTLVAFLLVEQRTLPITVIIVAIISLAAIQLAVQLVFFLHLGQERGSRWNLITFLFMVMVLGLVVGGSLWIMANLNYHMLTPAQTVQYMQDNEGL